MKHGLLKTIAERITENDVTPSFIVLGKEGYQPVPFAQTNFKPIPQAAIPTIAFVDGGNAELARGPDFSLQFIRTCAVIRGKKMMTMEAFCLVQATRENGKLAYKTDFIGLEGIRLPVIDIYEPSLAEGTHRVQPARVAELGRVLAEHLLAAWVLPELPAGALLVRDGDLEAHTLYEQNALREVYERARIGGVTIVGVSKTSTLLTDTGHAALPALAKRATLPSWYYHPIAASLRADHQASTCIAKFHPAAKHCFRIDIFDQQEALLPEVLGALMKESEDAAFLGYPYGLIEADRYARVREEERAYLKVRAELALGHLFKHREFSVDGHDHLNKAV